MRPIQSILFSAGAMRPAESRKLKAPSPGDAYRRNECSGPYDGYCRASFDRHLPYFLMADRAYILKRGLDPEKLVRDYGPPPDALSRRGGQVGANNTDPL
jgi:hypothetical protein